MPLPPSTKGRTSRPDITKGLRDFTRPIPSAEQRPKPNRPRFLDESRQLRRRHEGNPGHRKTRTSPRNRIISSPVPDRLRYRPATDSPPGGSRISSPGEAAAGLHGSLRSPIPWQPYASSLERAAFSSTFAPRPSSARSITASSNVGTRSPVNDE